MNGSAWRTAIGGSSALTRWSWIVGFPLGVVAGTLWGVSTGLPPIPWFLALSVMHAVLILPLWCLWRALSIATASGPRPWLAIAVFGILGALRTAGIMICAGLFGVTDYLSLAIQLVPYGIITGIVTFGVIAFIVDGVRDHRSTMQRLSNLEASIARARGVEATSLEELESDITESINANIAFELSRLKDSSGMSNESAAAALQHIAADVVRPLSHRLAEWDPGQPTHVDSLAPLKWQRSARLLIEEMRPAHPLLPVLLIELIALPVEFVAPRAGNSLIGILVVLMGGVVMFGLSWFLARWWPAGGTTIPRFVALVFAYVLIGAIATAVMSSVGRLLAERPTDYWVTPILLTLISVGASSMSALAIRRTANEDRLSEYVIRDAQFTARIKGQLEIARKRVAKFLHSNMQAELIASALSLSAPTGDVNVVAEVDRLASILDQRLSSEDQPIQSARERVVDLTSLWSGVLDIELDVDDDVWAALDRDVHAASSVDEVISEGLTNAVRHGTGSHVSVVMHSDEGEVTIRITSRGRIPATVEAGLGSRYLDDSTRSWDLTENDGHVHLTASVSVNRSHQ